jgi:citrate lyase subunit beta/citryl-CoA lyase
VENAQGLWNALEMARCARVERLAFGHLDFQRDLGIDGEDEEILFARSQLVFLSRLAGVGAPLDGITAALDDAEKLRRDVERARRLGFGGKLVIHPKQVETVGGAVRVGSEMVDAPVVERARNILRLAGIPEA